MTEPEQSEGEVILVFAGNVNGDTLNRTKTYGRSFRMLAFMGFFICVFVHRNARMTEPQQSEGEVILAFAGNVNGDTLVWNVFFL